MIRVLQIVRVMNRGGIECFLMNLYRNIDRENIQFDFLVQVDVEGAFDREILRLGGKIYHIPYLTDVGYVEYSKILFRFFKEHSEYQIVHSHLNSMSGPVLKMAAKVNIPVRVAHAHNGKLKGNFKERMLRSMLQSNIPQYATHLLACSQDAAKCIFGRAAKKAHIIHNGIDFTPFVFRESVRKEKRQELDIADKFVIGHVGRFYEQKNHKFILDIFYNIQQEREDAVLVLVGDGPLRQDMKKKAEAYHIENKVMFLGVREDIGQLMQAMDVFLFPSLYEGAPVVLLEAQTNGLQCIISDIISNEVAVTNFIHALSLSETDKEWANVVLRIKPTEYSVREEAIKYIENTGYDIREVVKQMSLFYQSKGGILK